MNRRQPEGDLHILYLCPSRGDPFSWSRPSGWPEPWTSTFPWAICGRSRQRKHRPLEHCVRNSRYLHTRQALVSKRVWGCCTMMARLASECRLHVLAGGSSAGLLIAQPGTQPLLPLANMRLQDSLASPRCLQQVVPQRAV